MFETNKIYCGDNLEIMKEFPDKCVDLVYLDPPFFSQKNYEQIWGDKEEVRSFNDRWEGGINHYVGWMAERLMEMYRILKDTGSIYLHCDWHASHYLKVKMDDVFGYDNFRNEITWKRTHAHNDPKRFGRNCDKILFYTKDNGYIFNVQHTPYTQNYIDNFFRGKDKRGVYRLVVLTGPMHGNKSIESNVEWKGYKPSQSKRHWSVPKRIVNSLVGEEKAKTLSITERLDLLNDNDYIVFSSNGIPNFKQYIDDMIGVPLQEIWDDVPVLSSQSKERLGYPTQKPEALLERIIKSSSNEGDIVFDPFCGCGTTSAVSKRLNRKFIGIDISPIACRLIAKRINYPEFDIIGLPMTTDDLSKMLPHVFQQWVCDKMLARNTGSKDKPSGGDGGKDGIIQSNLFTNKFAGSPLQVKQSDNVGVNVVKNFFATMIEMKKDRGFIVALSFGSGAIEQVAKYKSEHSKEIKLIKAEDLCNIPHYDFGTRIILKE